MVIECTHEVQTAILRRWTLKKNSNAQTNSDRAGKRGKTRGPVQRDAKEVMAELVAKLSQRLEPRPATPSAGDGRQQSMLGPNRERLTVGVDLGDKWSNFCILGLDGEKLTEGQLQTTQPDSAEFFQSLARARVVMEVEHLPRRRSRLQLRRHAGALQQSRGRPGLGTHDRQVQ